MAWCWITAPWSDTGVPKKAFPGQLIKFAKCLDVVARSLSLTTEGLVHRWKTQAFGYTPVATVLRKGRLRVIVYSRDHWPPHVHVVTPRGQAKILIEGPTGQPALEWNLGLSRRELALALAAIEDHRDLILTEWKRIHDHP